jgi:UDP-arabinose 4-epimerase
MQILISGGAGYIGSHTAKRLAQAGYEPIVLDNLRHGHPWAVRWGPFVEIDLSNREGLAQVFHEYRIEAVIHFAAFAYVGESMREPAAYFRNNVVNTLNLLDAMRAGGVGQIVFSSTCATYGEPHEIPIPEDHPQRPVNPYGESKLMVERLLAWYGQAYGLSWTALRYFNAAGADPDGEIGEVHDPETHLIPRVIAAAMGDLPTLDLFGTDYDTPDGTATRDYIHVTDLADAHVQALLRLSHGGHNTAFNLGTGCGHSVREVISMIEQVGRRKVPVNECPRRAGDPPMLVANPARACRELEWTPRLSSLQQIVETAWQWQLFSRNRGAELVERKAPRR